MHFLIFPHKYKYVSLSNSAFAYHVQYLIKSLFLLISETHCPDDENTAGFRSVVLIVIQLPDAAVNPRKFYWIQSPWKL